VALVVDSGGISSLSSRTLRAADLIRGFQREGLWPPVVPSPVLVECMRGDAGKDAKLNLLLKSCEVVELVDIRLARRAAWLRTRAQRGSAIDALVVASAEPNGSVLTSDPGDLSALAADAHDVRIVAI